MGIGKVIQDVLLETKYFISNSVSFLSGIGSVSAFSNGHYITGTITAGAAFYLLVSNYFDRKDWKMINSYKSIMTDLSKNTKQKQASNVVVKTKLKKNQVQLKKTLEKKRKIFEERHQILSEETDRLLTSIEEKRNRENVYKKIPLENRIGNQDILYDKNTSLGLYDLVYGA